MGWRIWLVDVYRLGKDTVRREATKFLQFLRAAAGDTDSPSLRNEEMGRRTSDARRGAYNHDVFHWIYWLYRSKKRRKVFHFSNTFSKRKMPRMAHPIPSKTSMM